MRRGALAVSALVLAACASGGSEDRVKEGTTTISTRERSTRLEGLNELYEVQQRTDQMLSAHPVPAGLPEVWKILPDVYGELGIEVQTLREDTWEIGNESLKTRRRLGKAPLSRIIGCGGVAGLNNADSYTITLFVVTLVKAEGEGASVVQTRVEASGIQPGTSQPPVQCRTTGWLEGEIAKRVRGKVMS